MRHYNDRNAEIELLGKNSAEKALENCPKPTNVSKTCCALVTSSRKMLYQHMYLVPIYKRENPESNQSNSRSCNNNRLAQIIWLLDSSLYKIQTSFNKKDT